MRVAVCVLTFHRPEGIRGLLDALGRIDVPEGDVTIDVVVVDNDGQASAEPVIDAARGALRWPIRYVVEQRRGIPYGRNAAVAAAGDADFVVFIDDDEVPEREWLRELLRVQRETGADVVTGPVLPVFPQPPPRWVVRGRFFERPRYATGTQITYARTSNVLIAGDLLREPWPPFAESFGLTGGDDTHFFMRVRLAGTRIVWADEAIVSEVVPTSRMSASWLVRRAYRRGNTLSLCLRDLRDTWPRRAKRVVAAIAHIGLGAVLAVTGVFQGRAGIVSGAQRIAHGAGLATGLFGSAYEEYRTIHGT